MPRRFLKPKYKTVRVDIPRDDYEQLVELVSKHCENDEDGNPVPEPFNVDEVVAETERLIETFTNIVIIDCLKQGKI